MHGWPPYKFIGTSFIGTFNVEIMDAKGKRPRHMCQGGEGGKWHSIRKHGVVKYRIPSKFSKKIPYKY